MLSAIFLCAALALGLFYPRRPAESTGWPGRNSACCTLAEHVIRSAERGAPAATVQAARQNEPAATSVRPTADWPLWDRILHLLARAGIDPAVAGISLASMFVITTAMLLGRIARQLAAVDAQPERGARRAVVLWLTCPAVLALVAPGPAALAAALATGAWLGSLTRHAVVAATLLGIAAAVHPLTLVLLPVVVLRRGLRSILEMRTTMHVAIACAIPLVVFAAGLEPRALPNPTLFEPLRSALHQAWSGITHAWGQPLDLTAPTLATDPHAQAALALAGLAGLALLCLAAVGTFRASGLIAALPLVLAALAASCFVIPGETTLRVAGGISPASPLATALVALVMVPTWVPAAARLLDRRDLLTVALLAPAGLLLGSWSAARALWQISPLP